MAIQRGLGRNFYDLLDDNMVSREKSSAATSIRVSEVEPRSDQPRKTFSHESLESLAESISQFGVLQPIVVRESKLLPGTYEILAPFCCTHCIGLVSFVRCSKAVVPSAVDCPAMYF